MIKEMASQHMTISEWFLYDYINSFSDYIDFIQALKNYGPEDQVILKINSGGGRVDVGFTIVQAILQTQATVICEVTYPSASMAAIIALSGNYLILNKHSSLMFHTYSGGSSGKSDEVYQDVLHTRETFNGMMNDLCTPFLTEEELKTIDEGKDFYIRWNDKSLKSRLKRQWPEIKIRNIP